MSEMRIIISGGGTGGHIFPAIAIADAIKKRYPDTEILFVGAEGRMEMKRVPDAGYEILGLPVAGFNRKNILKNFKVLWMLNKSMNKAKKIIKDFDPDIAIGVGGYASGPLLKVAASKGIPTLLQEQNSYPGVTNKLLAAKAHKICVAYDGMDKFFESSKIMLTGNPYRESLLSDATREEAAAFFELDPTKKTILVVGGSLGSRTINRSLLKKYALLDSSDIQVIWQAGELYFHDLFLEIPNRGGMKNVRLYDFLNRMDLAYKAADLVISRAGAGAISELSLLGKPAILIPSPNVAEDHQTKNAMALVNKNAALMVLDNESEEKLVSLALEVVNDDAKLAQLSENILKLAQRDSANRIVDEIVDIISNHKKK